MLDLSSSSRTIVATAFATFSLAGLANAAIIGDALVIRAESGTNVDTFIVPQASLAEGPPGVFVFTGVPLLDPGDGSNDTGTVFANLNLTFRPQTVGPNNTVGLNYSLTTGPGTTVFTFSTGQYVFGGLPAQSGSGSASVNVINANADAGVTYAGLQGGGGFLMQTDGGFGAAPTYTPAGLLFDVFGPAGLTNPTNANGLDFAFPTFLGGPRTSMSTQWRFSLTGGDQVAVVSTFNTNSVIPAPGAAALLAFGGMVLSRRRR